MRYSPAPMKDELARFGVAMESSLLAKLDKIADARGVARSEIMRDLVRAEVVRVHAEHDGPVVATLTVVYDHHVRELTERLTEFQHRLGHQVQATLHIHLDADRCLEVIVLRGRSGALTQMAERLLATRGVTHGRLEIVTDEKHRHTDHDHRAHGEAHGARREKPARRPRRG
jgi:CopG family transcriptional regulator, nickel-responsive regulator